MKALLDRLVRHMRWADARVLAALRALNTPPEEAVRQFAHIAAAEQIYLARLQGQDPFPQDFWPAHALEIAASIAGAAVDGLASFVTERDEAALRQPVRYRNSSGTYFETPLEQMLTHLALHGEHHRGQVARLVREAGGTPAATDFITFVREETPS